MCVIHEDGGTGSILVVEVGGIRLIVAHVVSRIHALILSEPFLA